MQTREHFEPIRKKDIPELEKYDNDDIHVIDYDEGNFHCTEIFSHEGVTRGCAKTKEEALEKTVDIYKKDHQKNK